MRKIDKIRNIQKVNILTEKRNLSNKLGINEHYNLETSSDPRLNDFSTSERLELESIIHLMYNDENWINTVYPGRNFSLTNMLQDIEKVTGNLKSVLGRGNPVKIANILKEKILQIKQ